MPRISKQQPFWNSSCTDTVKCRPKQKNAKMIKKVTARLIEISIKMEECIYYKKVMHAKEAHMYLQELIHYVHFCSDERSKQVVEKLVNFMKRTIEEEFEKLGVNLTSGNFRTEYPSQTFHEKLLQTNSLATTSPGIISSNMSATETWKTMNLCKDVDLNGKENSQLKNRQVTETQSNLIKVNNDDEVALLSQSILRDHDYTSWSGPTYINESPIPTISSGEPLSTPKTSRTISYTRHIKGGLKPDAPVMKKIVLVKIPNPNLLKTPSPAKYIKIYPIPGRDVKTRPSKPYLPNQNATLKKILNDSNPSVELPTFLVNNAVVKDMAPKKADAIPNEQDSNSRKKPKRKRNSIVEFTQDEIPKKRITTGKQKESQVTPYTEEPRKKKAAAISKKINKTKKKTNPNEVDLSWVENLRFVRVIERDEVCAPNMSLTDAFWKNLDYPPDWDDGVYLM